MSTSIESLRNRIDTANRQVAEVNQDVTRQQAQLEVSRTNLRKELTDLDARLGTTYVQMWDTQGIQVMLDALRARCAEEKARAVQEVERVEGILQARAEGDYARVRSALGVPAPVAEQPAEQPTQPTQPVEQPVEQSAQPVEQPAQPVQPVEQPVEQPAQPAQPVPPVAPSTPLAPVALTPVTPAPVVASAPQFAPAGATFDPQAGGGDSRFEEVLEPFAGVHAFNSQSAG